MKIYNIFKKSKTKKKPVKTPKIIADIHEKNSLILSELKESKQVRLEIKPLKIADYLIGNIAIERKTTSDFISSMINKRLIQQLNQMQKYKRRLLIIEGDRDDLYNDETKLNPNAIRGFILSIKLNYNTPTILTQDYEDTAKYLVILAKQQAKPKQEPSLHSRIPKTKKQQKQYILEAFPNIGPKKAQQLIKKFKTLKQTFNATTEELAEVLKNQTNKFTDLLKEP